MKELLKKKTIILIFKNPLITPTQVSTKLKVASIDIETGVASNRLYSIGVHIWGVGEELERVFMLGEREEARENNLYIYSSQKELLQAFLNWYNEVDPDIIIGWHVIGFDLKYLEEKCQQFLINFSLGRNQTPPILTESNAGHFAVLEGRIVIDGLAYFKNSPEKFANYKLDTIAEVILGKHKTIGSNR